MKTLTVNRTPKQIYDELRKHGTFEFIDKDKQFFTFDFGGFTKAYQVTFVENLVVDVREYPIDYLNHIKEARELYKSVANLKFGDF